MSDEETGWERLLDGIRRGDEESCRLFWEQYSPLIEKLADRNIASGLRRRVGPESVALSACRTFFRRARGGEFQLPDSESLWRLLCAITLNKIRMRHRDHQRKKRALDQEVHLDAGEHGGSHQAMGLPSREPSPEEAAEFHEQLQALVSQLDEVEQKVLDLKLQQYTHEEIAKKLRCSDRTVRRRMDRIKATLSVMLEAD